MLNEVNSTLSESGMMPGRGRVPGTFVVGVVGEVGAGLGGGEVGPGSGAWIEAGAGVGGEVGAGSEGGEVGAGSGAWIEAGAGVGARSGAYWIEEGPGVTAGTLGGIEAGDSSSSSSSSTD